MENDFQKITMAQDIICPVCFSTKTTFFTTKKSFDLFTCGDCGLLFIFPVPQSLDAIYNQEYFSGADNGFGYTDYDRDKEPMIPTFKKYLDLIQKYKVAAPLLDKNEFKNFYLDEWPTLAWTCGFDLAPESLYERATGKRITWSER